MHCNQNRRTTTTTTTTITTTTATTTNNKLRRRPRDAAYLPAQVGHGRQSICCRRLAHRTTVCVCSLELAQPRRHVCHAACLHYLRCCVVIVVVVVVAVVIVVVVVAIVVVVFVVVGYCCCCSCGRCCGCGTLRPARSELSAAIGRLPA
jgi:Flp pilus assembly protein TadB